MILYFTEILRIGIGIRNSFTIWVQILDQGPQTDGLRAGVDNIINKLIDFGG